MTFAYGWPYIQENFIGEINQNMVANRIAVVTGGNKGVGLEICRQLASSGDDVLVVLTARDEQRGSEAVDKLKASGLSNVVFHQLDVTNPTTIASLAGFIKTEFGKLDILVNNAGINGVIVDAESFWSLNLQPASKVVDEKAGEVKKVASRTYETSKECLKTNYYGAKQVIEALLPLLLQSSSARIVNVSSKLGQLKNVTNEMSKKMLSDPDELTEERVEEFVNGFLHDAKEDLLEKRGWTDILSAYIVSKAALNAYSRILAKKFPSLRVNAVSPGFVKTDMSFQKGKHTVEEGAKGPVMLALIPDDGPSGQFFLMTEQSTF